MKKTLSIAIAVLCLSLSKGFIVCAAEIPEKALVKIDARAIGKTGSGFIVKVDSTGAYIVTASHVVEGDEHPDVVFTTRRNVPASATIAALEGGDSKGLAILFVSKQNLPPQISALRLAPSIPAVHERLSVAGFPRSLKYLSVITSDISQRGRDIVFMEPLAEGFSGSPLLKDGTVAGIVVERRRDYSFLVSANDIKAFVIGSRIHLAPGMKVKFLRQWGSEGKGNGQFLRPWGIGVSWQGDIIYVADGYQHRVQIFNSSGAYRGQLPGIHLGNRIEAGSGVVLYAINYDGNGRNQRVEIYHSVKEVRRFNLIGSGPRDLAADTGGKNIYVTDILSHSIYRYQTTGISEYKVYKWSSWGSRGTGNGQFQSPWGVVYDRHRHRRVYVADTGNNRVQAFTAEGKFLMKWGEKGTGDGQFDRPIDLAVDTARGNVYVLDRRNARVQVFSPDGEFLGKWGSAGRGTMEFMDPYGIAIDANDNVYVVDPGAHRVQAFRVQWQ